MADKLKLFPAEQVVGVFRGFREGGMEFHADLALPYRTDFHNTPMHGQFLLVQLETPEEAVLGRITSLSSEGRLSGPSGEDFNIRAVREGRAVPEGLREDYLKYRVNIRVLRTICGRVTREARHVRERAVRPSALQTWREGGDARRAMAALGHRRAERFGRSSGLGAGGAFGGPA